MRKHRGNMHEQKLLPFFSPFRICEILETLHLHQQVQLLTKKLQLHFFCLLTSLGANIVARSAHKRVKAYAKNLRQHFAGK